MAKHERTRVEGARVLSCLAIALPLLNMDKHCGMMCCYMFSLCVGIGVVSWVSVGEYVVCYG